MLRDFTEEEQEQLRRLLEKLIQSMQPFATAADRSTATTNPGRRIRK